MSQFDIAIAGGGLVGASLACALAPLGYRVAVIEAAEARGSHPPSYDDRTLSLGLASCKILHSLDLWMDLQDSATPICRVEVTEQNRPGRVVLDPAELGLPAFGHVIEARAFGLAVMKKLHSLDGIHLLQPASVSGVDMQADAVTFQVATATGTQTHSARLMVAADGTDSTVRQFLHLPVEEKSYGHSAVICNITPEHAHQGRAFERMTATGPFALLPFTQARCGLVWTARNLQVDGLLALPEAEFLVAAAQRSDGSLGQFLKMGRRSTYPLKLLRATKDIAHRAVVLGNAAHTLHPVGAQGFNLGLRDVASLAEILADARIGGQMPDPGDPALLQAYSEWRKPDFDATIAYTDALASLFTSRVPVTRMLRSMGMLAHALLPPLRRQLASKAMGFRGKAPRMALGERLFGPAA